MPVLRQNAIIQSLTSLSRRTRNIINSNVFGKELSCEAKSLFFKYMNINVIGVSNIDIPEADCACLKATLPFTQTCGDCCGITSYNYITDWNLGAASISNVQATGNPDEYTLDIVNLVVSFLSSSDLILAGLVLNIADDNFNILYSISNIENTGIPASIPITITSNPLDGLIYIRFHLLSSNQDGIIATSGSLITIEDAAASNIIVVDSIKGILLDNTDCNNPTYSIVYNTPSVQKNALIVIYPYSEHVGKSTIFTSGSPQIATGFISKDASIFNYGMFFANCSKSKYQYYIVSFNCSNTELSINQLLSFGLAYNDETFLECSLDGVTWNLFYSPVYPNTFSVENIIIAWDKILFPEGEVVLLRMRSTQAGVLFSSSVLVDSCS